MPLSEAIGDLRKAGTSEIPSLVFPSPIKAENLAGGGRFTITFI